MNELELECIIEAIDNNFTRAVIIIDTDHEELISNVEKLLDESDITYKMEWKSKYNEYVLYDYEPFCTEGYYLRFNIERTLLYKINWVLYNANKYIKAVNSLNKLLEV
jgi:hypothetical protein